MSPEDRPRLKFGDMVFYQRERRNGSRAYDSTTRSGFFDLGTRRRLLVFRLEWKSRLEQFADFCLGKLSLTVFKIEFEISLKIVEIRCPEVRLEFFEVLKQLSPQYHLHL